MSILTVNYLKLLYHMSMHATSMQLNEDTEVLQCNHRLRLNAQHDRSERHTFLRTPGDLLESQPADFVLG